MPLMLSVVATSLSLAAAPVRLDRVDVLSEDAGTFLNYDLALIPAYPVIGAARFVEQVKVVFALPAQLYAGVSIASQSLSFESPLWRAKDGHGLFWTVSLHTRLLLPYGAHAGVDWRCGPVRLGLGASVSTEAAWARPAWSEWKVLPVLSVGFGPNIAPGM